RSAKNRGRRGVRATEAEIAGGGDGTGRVQIHLPGFFTSNGRPAAFAVSLHYSADIVLACSEPPIRMSDLCREAAEATERCSGPWDSRPKIPKKATALAR